MPAWHRKPYVTKKGHTRHAVGYTDENGVERSKGGFTSRTGAGGTVEWLRRYRAAEGRGVGSLKAFLDEEIRGITVRSEARTLEEAMAEWLYLSRPSARNGLAKTTYASYFSTYNNHIRPRLGIVPVSEFAEPKHPAELRDHLRRSQVGEPTIERALAVLSSMLSWAVERGMIEVNGVKRLDRKRYRKSDRAGADASTSTPTEHTTSARRPAGWALAPAAVAVLAFEMLQAPRLSELDRWYDATWVVSQFLLGTRNQDIWGLTWFSVAGEEVSFTQAVTAGELGLGKVKGSVRTVPQSPTLRQWMTRWRTVAASHGLGTTATDFIFPGSESRGHVAADEAKNWHRRRFKAAAGRAAGRHPEFAYLARSTPYSLRRGHITTRLQRGEELDLVADECATSVEMLVRNYWSYSRNPDRSHDPLDVQFNRAWRQYGPAKGRSGNPARSARQMVSALEARRADRPRADVARPGPFISRAA